MITTIIFDVGNVLVHTPGFPNSLAILLGEKLHLPAKQIFLKYEKILPKLESGQTPISKLNLPCKVRYLERIYQKSAERLFYLNKDMFNYALDLKADYRVGILSNVDRYIAQIPLMKKVYRSFDPRLVLLSYEVKTRKPGEKIYRLYLDKIGEKAENCLMIDNVPKNIEMAKKIKMKGIFFKNYFQLKNDLPKFLYS